MAFRYLSDGFQVSAWNLLLTNQLPFKLIYVDFCPMTETMVSQNQDYELVKKFLQGDESSFNKLVYRYQQKIYWHARRMTGNHLDADEIVQEVLIVMYNKLGTFRFNSSLYTWIYRITATRSLNYLKKKNLRRFFSTDSEEAVSVREKSDIIKNIEDKEKTEKIAKLLQKLPAKQRQVFIFRNMDELSYEEISEITGTSTGALKASYFHAVKKITEFINEDE
jgi:RNA polymerase sigma factor (sigma-70 family)